MCENRIRLLLSGVALVMSLSSVLLSAQSPPAAAADANADNVLRSEVNLVSVYFTVRDRQKHLVSDLERERFRVLEEGKEQPIKFFAHHSDVMLNVGLLLDTGTNMAWILNEEAEASSMFLNRVVRPTDLGFLLGYAARVETLQVPTSDIPLLQERAESIRAAGTNLETSAPAPPAFPGAPFPPIGATGIPPARQREAHLYDAIRVGALRYLQHEVGRKAVVIIALSGDSRSESTIDDALDTLLANDVIAYVLQIYDPPRERTGFDHCDVTHTYERDKHGEYVLKKLAEATGGRMLEVHGVDKLEEALDEIAEELHHQYSLGYYPQNPALDGTFRKIQITAQGEEFKVFARKGYYAAPRN